MFLSRVEQTKRENTILTLMLDLSYNFLERAQNNAVAYQNEEMDRVGFEPTTSAH